MAAKHKFDTSKLTAKANALRDLKADKTAKTTIKTLADRVALLEQFLGLTA